MLSSELHVFKTGSPNPQIPKFCLSWVFRKIRGSPISKFVENCYTKAFHITVSIYMYELMCNAAKICGKVCQSDVKWCVESHWNHSTLGISHMRQVLFVVTEASQCHPPGISFVYFSNEITSPATLSAAALRPAAYLPLIILRSSSLVKSTEICRALYIIQK